MTDSPADGRREERFWSRLAIAAGVIIVVGVAVAIGARWLEMR